MTRKECLDAAAQCVLQDRASQYGGVEDNFARIAKLWSVYTGTVLDGIDVAMMMALLKVARIRGNKTHADSFVDLAGYAACGAELAGRAEAYRQSIEKAGAEYKRLRAEAEAQPEFNPGDRVEALSFDGSRWEDAVVERTEHASTGWHCTVRLASGERHCLPVKSIRRPSRAEGCEALVEKDAPQTPEAVYQHIVDSNPATYGHPHNPTGEELAEMAREEDADGGA